ncbi:hypothetical protein [Spiroplasma endosymbiont of Tiphia femorata]|uniref:hypothetical protein n=1 Tax=Spiroplasma endosymbiont of Tiphia femorata TaxID=3066326 RepID=UPI0030CCA11C
MKKQSFLLFKNAFKQAFRNKIQLVGLIVLVLLSSTIFSLMQTSLARISDEYSTLVAKSNLHDFVIDLSNTTPKTISNKISTSTTAVDEKNDFDINNIANDAGNEFIWDRVEGRTMQLDNNSNPRILKILTYNQDARIDKLIISDGYQIGDSNNPDKTPSWKQVVINKEFAQKNNLHINDTIRVQSDQLGSSLKVSGYDLNDAAYSSYNWLIFACKIWSWLKISVFSSFASFSCFILCSLMSFSSKIALILVISFSSKDVELLVVDDSELSVSLVLINFKCSFFLLSFFLFFLFLTFVFFVSILWELLKLSTCINVSFFETSLSFKISCNFCFNFLIISIFQFEKK